MSGGSLWTIFSAGSSWYFYRRFLYQIFTSRIWLVKIVHHWLVNPESRQQHFFIRFLSQKSCFFFERFSKHENQSLSLFWILSESLLKDIYTTWRVVSEWVDLRAWLIIPLCKWYKSLKKSRVLYGSLPWATSDDSDFIIFFIAESLTISPWFFMGRSEHLLRTQARLGLWLLPSLHRQERQESEEKTTIFWDWKRCGIWTI